jgi:hypothetical protein
MSQMRNESWGRVTPASPSVHRTPRLPPYQKRSLSLAEGGVNGEGGRLCMCFEWRLARVL